MDSVEMAVVGAVLDVDVGGGVRRLGREAGLVLGLTVKMRLSTLGLAVTSLLVDADLFADWGRLRAAALFFNDADLFVDVRVARGRLLLVDGGREGFVRLFVTFPSVCLRLR